MMRIFTVKKWSTFDLHLYSLVYQLLKSALQHLHSPIQTHIHSLMAEAAMQGAHQERYSAPYPKNSTMVSSAAQICFHFVDLLIPPLWALFKNRVKENRVKLSSSVNLPACVCASAREKKRRSSSA